MHSGLLAVFFRVYEVECEVGEEQIVSDLDLWEVSEVKLDESKEHIVIVIVECSVTTICTILTIVEEEETRSKVLIRDQSSSLC